MRIRSTPFQAEKTLTKDTVPVNVDAVLFWVAKSAARTICRSQGRDAALSWPAGGCGRSGDSGDVGRRSGADVHSRIMTPCSLRARRSDRRFWRSSR